MLVGLSSCCDCGCESGCGMWILGGFVERLGLLLLKFGFVIVDIWGWWICVVCVWVDSCGSAVLGLVWLCCWVGWVLWVICCGLITGVAMRFGLLYYVFGYAR